MELARGDLVCASAPERPESASEAMAKSVMSRMRFIGILLDLADSWIALIGASLPHPKIDCFRPCIGHASCRMPRQKPPRMGFYPNYLPKDGLFLGRLSWECHRAVSATAVTLSDRIVRLSDQFVFQTRGQ